MSLHAGSVVPNARPWRIRIKKAFNLMYSWFNQVLLFTGLQPKPEQCKKNYIGHWKLAMVNAIVAGAEAACAVGFAFIPPLLLKAGYTESQMSVLLGMSPLLCLYTVPALGRWSDSLNSKNGSRRPFIFALGLLEFLALCSLSTSQWLETHFSVHYGIVLMAVSAVILDYSSQALLNPVESLISDICRSSSETAGFLVYSAMSSFGLCLGYLMAGIDWGSLTMTNEQTAFSAVSLFLIVTLAVTMANAREEVYLRPNLDLCLVDDNDEGSESEQQQSIFVVVIGFITRPIVNVVEAPLVLKKLYLANMLAWMGIFAHNFFATDFFASVVIGARADSPLDASLFEEGVRMGSFGLMLHSVVACMFSLSFQAKMVNGLGLKWSYAIGMFVFAVSMLLSVFFPTAWVVCVCNAVSGIGTSVATHVPLTLVTMYQSHPDFFYADVTARHGTAFNMSVMDSGLYISQIILSMIAGPLVESTGMNQMYMVISSVCGFSASYACLKLSYSIETTAATSNWSIMDNKRLLNQSEK